MGNRFQELVVPFKIASPSIKYILAHLRCRFHNFSWMSYKLKMSCKVSLSVNGRLTAIAKPSKRVDSGRILISQLLVFEV